MPYALLITPDNFGQSTNPPEISTGRWTGGGNANWWVEVEFEWLGNLTERLALIMRDGSSARFPYIENGKVGAVTINIESASPVISPNQRAIVRLESIGTQKRLLVDAGSGFVEVASNPNFTTNCQYSMFPSRGFGSQEARDLIIYAVRFNGGTYTDAFDGTTAPSSGTSWPSVSGNRTADFETEAVGDAQWLFYEDVEPSDDIDATIAITMPQFSAAVSATTTAPGVTASVAFTMPQFTALVDADQQAPQYAASVALTMPQFTAAITGEASAPTAGATVAFSMPQFVAAATADSAAPQYPASAAFTMPQFTAAVQAQAIAPGSGASVSFVMPQFTAAATAESTVPESPAVAAYTMPQFGVVASAEASLPATGAVVAYTMPQLTVAASGASTVPTLTANVAYTMPQFGVMVLTDETPLGTAPGARLAWVAGNNKLAYNVGSNRLSWRA